MTVIPKVVHSLCRTYAVHRYPQPSTGEARLSPDPSPRCEQADSRPGLRKRRVIPRKRAYLLTAKELTPHM